MTYKTIYKTISSYCFFLLVLLLFSCSTGIESTKTIKYSKNEKKELVSSPEELFISKINPQLLKDWKKGKEFVISDNRITLILEPSSPISSDSLVGKRVYYNSFTERMTPGGNTIAVITFDYNNIKLSYSTGKSVSEALSTINSLDIPMMLDIESVESYKKLLEGKKVWTKSSLWYDKDGEKIEGRQFVPVTIDNVSMGNSNFPLCLSITDEEGKPAFIYMNIPNRGLESRTFPNLFLLSDPRLSYPTINDEIWKLICQRKVINGMTKEQCKLALGNPDEVNSGHDWNQTIDIWNYKNGCFLQFCDGLLTKFRM